jgi:hypothetical protein
VGVSPPVNLAGGPAAPVHIFEECALQAAIRLRRTAAIGLRTHKETTGQH